MACACFTFLFYFWEKFGNIFSPEHWKSKILLVHLTAKAIFVSPFSTFLIENNYWH
jgi:hypothetical protein